MTKAEIGTFTPEQARLIWLDYQRRQASVPQIRDNFPQRRIIDEVSPHRVFIRNTTDEEIPPYGCVQITGTSTFGERTVVDVEKPTSTTGEYLFNSQFAIDAENGSSVEESEQTNVGWAYRFGVVRMIGDPPSEAGAQYQPTVGSYEVSEGTGPFVVYGEDIIVTKGLVGRFAASAEGGAKIEFAIDAGSSSSGSSGGSSGDDRACGTDTEYEGTLRVRVVGRPCGVSKVCGEDADGYIEVIDRPAGGFLKNRTDAEIEGMTGFADLLEYEDDEAGSSSSSASGCGKCKWVITWMNWFKPRQAVQDVIERPTEITIELENRWYWNRCTLPDEEIILVDCIEDAGGSSSSGAE